jgi:hypothetical protein
MSCIAECAREDVHISRTAAAVRSRRRRQPTPPPEPVAWVSVSSASAPLARTAYVADGPCLGSPSSNEGTASPRPVLTSGRVSGSRRLTPVAAARGGRSEATRARIEQSQDRSIWPRAVLRRMTFAVPVAGPGVSPRLERAAVLLQHRCKKWADAHSGVHLPVRVVRADHVALHEFRVDEPVVDGHHHQSHACRLGCWTRWSPRAARRNLPLRCDRTKELHRSRWPYDTMIRASGIATGSRPDSSTTTLPRQGPAIASLMGIW